MSFKELNIDDFNCNPFSKIGKDWMLISSGTAEKFNTMTASWGGFGVMWGKNVAFTFIRPQRYTKEFVDNNERFSLCFFDDSYKKSLSYLGSVSGRDENKVEKCGLTSCFVDGVPCFEEADLVIVCRKLYVQEMVDSCFVDGSLDGKWYENEDYHFMYVSEVERIVVGI